MTTSIKMALSFSHEIAHLCIIAHRHYNKGGIMTIHSNITELIGSTPLVELTNYESNHELCARLIGKVEYFNPGRLSEGPRCSINA